MIENRASKISHRQNHVPRLIAKQPGRCPLQSDQPDNEEGGRRIRAKQYLHLGIMFNDIFTALGVNLLRLSVDGEGIHRNRNFKPLLSELRYSAGAPSPSSTAENAIKR